MSTRLCPAVPLTYSKAAVFDDFFDDHDWRTIREFESREQPPIGVPADSCKTNLLFGFFFDGTKNNYVLAEKGLNHSNVARLYDCYPGLSVPGVLPAKTDWMYKPENYTHFFKTYIPGVASPFKEVNDSGEGHDYQRGAASGYLGEARIIWALIQAINNVHRYFLKSPLVPASEAVSLIGRIRLNASALRAMKLDVPGDKAGGDKRARDEFMKVLARLHRAAAQHWPDPSTGRPKKIDPGIVQTIHISVFGFSRGATQARAFANWLCALCRLDALQAGKFGTLSLGGFDVKFDFLGLFDTVASIGAGNTFGNSVGAQLDGHGAWADAEMSLRIPDGVPCVHLVAAHEVRRSFPVDSIAVGGILPAKCEEVVIPGVHSDIGCGYSPCEQGRGVDPTGADMLSRIPLLYMYKSARIAGVPLKLEFASEASQQRFKITSAVIDDLNAYLSAAVHKTGSLTAIMREQAKLHILWRLSRRVRSASALETSHSFLRASTFDQNDLHSANREFELEIAAFEAWLAQRGKETVPQAQGPGFNNEHEKEWEEIATWWKKAPPPAAVLKFFDDYVHDSRAWFKLIPGNPDNEDDTRAGLHKQLELLREERAQNARGEKVFLENQNTLFGIFGKKRDASSPKYLPQPSAFSEEQSRLLDEFSRTNKIPRMLTQGREPFEWGPLKPKAGYLRYRKIYAGADNRLISQAEKIESDSKQLV